MIIDAFPFFNELDLLEIRLNELDPVVDYFVLVEATVTHSGFSKPLYYGEHMCDYRFLPFGNKIIHVVVDDMPMEKDEIEQAISPQDRAWMESGYQVEDNWVRERYQRNAMMRVLKDFAPDDIIIIEDADEMVRPEIVAKLPEILVDGSNAVEQVLHTYYFNWKCTNMPWWGTKILRNKFVDNPSEHRFHTPASKYIYDGGWHFGFMGGADAIKAKLQAYAHQEFNTDSVFDGINELLKNQKDALGRLYQYKIVPIDETYPAYIRNNVERFKKYLWS